MPSLTAKKTVRKKSTATSRKSVTVKSATTKKKGNAKHSGKASVVRPSENVQQPVASDGIPWPQLPAIFGRGNLTVKQIRGIVLRTVAAAGVEMPVKKARQIEMTRIKRTKK